MNSPHDADRRAQFDTRDHIDRVCDAFEAEWLGGHEPDLRRYLDRFEEPEARGALLEELLLLDVDYRRQRGQERTRDDYLRQLPQFAEQIETLAFRLGLPTEATPSHSGGKMRTAAFSPGMRIDRFELLEELGAGAKGVVWRARDTRLGRDVAVKLPRSGELSEEELLRFLGEARAAAKLRHPAIVSIHEVGQEGDVPFIVSDFIAGADLRQRLVGGRSPARQAAELCQVLAAALHHAHENGIVHRDFKPGNVLIDEEGRPHIADFGLAKVVDDAPGMTRDGTVLGTPAYMSPEQARGESGRVDRKSDVYALGAVLYEMLTGAPPFSGDPLSVIHAVAQQEPPRPRRLDRRIPRDLETICLKALDKEPHRRYPTAEAMADDLGRFLAGESIVARRVGLLERGWRRVRRSPALGVSLVLALLTLMALGVVWVVTERNRELLGLRTVAILTKPAGARVALVALDEITGEPDPQRVTRPDERTPLRVELAPGDYFVVAALRDGRFHEVFRHVPEGGARAGVGNYGNWKILDDGTVRPTTIQIPEPSVVDGMVRLEGSEDFEMGVEGSRTTPLHRRPVASFYLDPREYSVGDQKHHEVGSYGPPPGWQELPDEHALRIQYDWAVRRAEALGKRLPFEAEFEYAATRPYIEYVAVDDSAGPSGAVDSPGVENRGRPRIWGLLSNLPEWTATSGFFYGARGERIRTELLKGADHRLVRGGGEGMYVEHLPASGRDPHARAFASRYEPKPNIGFRCVRSAEPPFLGED